MSKRSNSVYWVAGLSCWAGTGLCGYFYLADSGSNSALLAAGAMAAVSILLMALAMRGGTQAEAPTAEEERARRIEQPLAGSGPTLHYFHARVKGHLSRVYVAGPDLIVIDLGVPTLKPTQPVDTQHLERMNCFLAAADEAGLRGFIQDGTRDFILAGDGLSGLSFDANSFWDRDAGEGEAMATVLLDHERHGKLSLGLLSGADLMVARMHLSRLAKTA